MTNVLIISTVFGLLLTNIISAQPLTTKCPSEDWTHYLERCYLVVSYSHSWFSAYNYCQKYSAILVQPTGYVINDEVIAQFATLLPDSKSFWTGYNKLPDNSEPDHVGYFSDGQETSVHVGVWGMNEPDTAFGLCAYVSTDDHKWYMGDCDRVKNFVCEIDPCPAGERDTYMCNGKCLGMGVLCNGIDDCGNNEDEQNCTAVAGGQCTTAYAETEGVITLPTTPTGGVYEVDTTCTWQISIPPGNRIVLEFQYFDTEKDSDFLEIWDGGQTLATSELSAHLSGSIAEYTFISSYNFLTLRFVSDSTIGYTGFQVTWKTVLDCMYAQIYGYRYSNVEITLGDLKLASLQTIAKCKEECDDNDACVGFRYDSSVRMCYYMNMLPVLQPDANSDLWIQTCHGDTTVQAAVPLLPSDLVAIATFQPLPTPFHPYQNYLGNLELEYTITTADYNLITLDVITLELCCGDNIYIYDKDHDLLDILTSTSSLIQLLSTSNTVYIKMDLRQHWQCSGALIQYKQGCDIIMTGSGSFNSPGYGTAKSYPDLMECVWTVQAPSPDRSVTVIFDDFDLHATDSIWITYANGTKTEHTGSSLYGTAVTSGSLLNITMSTSSLDNGRGYMASFSPGCQVLDAEGYQLSSSTFDYGNQVIVSCETGYYFTGSYSDQTSVTLKCESGGQWSIPDLPICAQGKCGPVQYIVNGYIIVSSGLLGGDITQYGCDEGYIMEGEDSVGCLANNSWEAAPSCVSLECPSISEEASTTESQLVYGDGIHHGSIVNLTCNSPYSEIIGAQTVQCQNGNWDFVSDINPSHCRPIQCETPVVDNAELTPDSPYTLSQEINATCVEGYYMVGEPTFNCGGTSSPPTCFKQPCSLEQFSRVLSSDNSGETEYTYGDSINVTCTDSYYLDNIATSEMTITCLHTGEWSNVPKCAKRNCGKPYEVFGSEYVYTVEGCLDYNCSFTFQCQNKYDKFGSSSKDDDLVRCGYIHDGLWDFGDLRCIGGQCPDPGYPASGALVGNSFEEGSVVMFECETTGYEPLDTSGAISQGMACQYNEISDVMEWIGDMPTCTDTQPPQILHCDKGSISYIADMLVPLDVPEVEAIDNNAIMTWNTYPINTQLTDAFSQATIITHVIVDVSNNSAMCTVRVTIPDTMDCKNDLSTNIELTADLIINIDNSIYIITKTSMVDIQAVPATINVTAEAATLNTIYESEVTTIDTDTGEIRDQCTIQFRFHAPSCADWAFEIHNGMKTCSNAACTVACNDGYYFIDDPTVSSVDMTCSRNVWDKEAPVCAEAYTGFIMYTAKYSYRYTINGTLSNTTECIAAYTPAVNEQLVDFASAMATKCNSGRTNPVQITMLVENTRMAYSVGANELTVNFQFKLVLEDESVADSQLIKDSCSNTILSSMDIDTIGNLEAIANPECGSGVFFMSSVTPIFEYECLGYRRFFNLDGNRMCLDCPLGYYYYNDVASHSHSCLECPVGTYGTASTDGAMCTYCAAGTNSGFARQTDISSCNVKGSCKAGTFSFDGLEPCSPCPKNFFSSLPYSHTCRACPGEMFTYSAQSTSILDCKTLAAAAIDNVSTPCTNRCVNGTCSLIRSNYYCSCSPGFTGRNCEDEINFCSSNPCRNNKPCTLVNGIYACQCSSDPNEISELSGEFCERDDYGCADAFCNNNGTCHNRLQSHSCKCPSYSGFRNNMTSDNGSCNTEIDPCTVDPCANDGICVPHGHYHKSCDCKKGWTGSLCENNLDDCVPDYCENGAVCIDGENAFTCNCATGFYGAHCQFHAMCDIKCTDNEELYCNTCVNSTTEICMNVNDDFSCICLSGYEGRSCEVEKSICNSHPCEHDGKCIEVSDTVYNCSCSQPWTGDHCESQINNCPDGNQCYNGGECYSTTTGYMCSCPENYIGVDCSELYELCARASPCVGSGSNCSVSDDGEFTCNCESGLTGDVCETMLPSCATNLCENGATCSEVDGDVECVCVDGYTGDSCETDIDDCSPNPCSNIQECVDGIDSHTCICALGKRGVICDKDVGADFDYVIYPKTQCRADASVAMFGVGEMDIDAFSIVFWVRFTAVNSDAVIISVFGSQSGATLIPESPDFQLKYYASNVDAFISSTSNSIRKRDTKNLVYKDHIDDGHWHHIVVLWSKQSGEITLYVDGQYKDQAVFSENNPVANTGFLVFGDFDPASGTSNPESSFEGRISRLYVVDTELSTTVISQLYLRDVISLPGVILNQERSTMLYYSVDYNSELQENGEICLPGDETCPGFNSGALTPNVTSCPGDTFVVTTREMSPSWTDPEFTGNFISTILNGNNGLEFGVHGVSYASLDEDGDAALCAFRVFNSEVGCGTADGGTKTCVSVVDGGTRCSDTCPGGQALSGDVPLYQTCSMYGMWDESVKYTDYAYPQCSDTMDLTNRVTLELTAAPVGEACADILEEYRVAVLNKFNILNSETNDALCTTNCVNAFSNAFNCEENNIHMSIIFGILSSTMQYGGGTFTTEEILKIAVGDLGLFDYDNFNDPATFVVTDVKTLSMTISPRCPDGYMVSSGRCVLCAVGTYYDSTTLSCKRCAIGTYRSDLSDPESSCISCDSSVTTATDGSTSVDFCIASCPLGQYYNIPQTVNQGSCQDCETGFYQDTIGQIHCTPCPLSMTTDGTGSTSISACVTPESLTTTTTTTESPPQVGASTENTGLGTGVIVAVVLAVLLVIAIIILIIICCCCQHLLPCLAKKKQVVSPGTKDGYYARKYGDSNMQFVSYNLQDIREMKGKPLDRVPFVEQPMSDESGSVKTDISVHVPVFIEKMNGSIKKKSMYMSNGSVALSRSGGRTPRDIVMTSSPRERYENEMDDAYVKPKKRRRRNPRQDRSTSEHRGRDRRHRQTNEDVMVPAEGYVSGSLPKALAPMPKRLKSRPPEDVILRPSSALDQPRVQVVPSQYEDFLDQSPTRAVPPQYEDFLDHSPTKAQHSQLSHLSSQSQKMDTNRARSQDKKKSESLRQPPSYVDDEDESKKQHSGGYYDEVQAPFNVRRIQVESDDDEDLR